MLSEPLRVWREFARRDGRGSERGVEVLRGRLVGVLGVSGSFMSADVLTEGGMFACTNCAYTQGRL